MEEAPVTRMLAALEAMVAEAVAVVAATAVMEGQVVHMAAEVAAEALPTRTMPRQDPVGQKAPTEALAVPGGSISDRRTEKPEAPARTPSEKGWILKALEPEVLLPPSMVEVAAVAVTEVSAVRLALAAWLAVAAEVAMAETAVLVVAIVVLVAVAVAVATAEMAVLEETALMELAVAVAMEKLEMAEQEQPQELRPTTAGLPQEAEASVPIFHPTSIMALADLASASSPTMHKEARR